MTLHPTVAQSFGQYEHYQTYSAAQHELKAVPSDICDCPAIVVGLSDSMMKMSALDQTV